MNYFYMITNETKDPAGQMTEYVRRYLEERGKKYTEKMEQVECVLVLGGDGTLLRAATDLVHLDVPFLGINLGSLGFLAEVDRTGIEKALDLVIAGRFEIENRMMLKGIINDREIPCYHNHALNDVVILGKTSMKLIYFTLYINGLLLNRYAADGMIISTPTGSTGYNLSAGGPIVEPKAEILLLTPLCPHSLQNRSLIFSAEDEVVIELGEDKYGKEQQAEVVFDGSRPVGLVTGDRIQITKSEKTTAILKLSTTNFLENLHRKMSH